MLVKLLKATDCNHFDPIVISLLDEGTQGAAIREQGVPLHSVGMRSALDGPGAWLRLRRCLRDLQPILIHAWMYHGCLASALAGGRAPMIWSIRQSLPDGQYDKVGTRLVIRLLPRFARHVRAITYNSFTSARQHEALHYPPGLTRVIPNGFELDIFRMQGEERLSMRGTLGLPADATVVGHLARFHPLKDHLGFIRTASRLAAIHNGLWFLMAGTGVDSSNRTLVDAIREAGLSGQVLLLGERADIPSLLNAMDLFCSSSVGEGFPNVIGEAMACEVPCVVTDAGDSAVIVGDTGIVVPPSDPEALAKGLNELLGMPPEKRRALGQAARRRIEERFSLTAVKHQYEALYEDVVGENG